MTQYVDTSVLAAYYCPELLSGQAEQRLRLLRPPILSWLVVVEFHSALAKKVRQQSLSESGAQQIQELFEAHRSEAYYRIASVQEPDFMLARRWLTDGNTALRTLDALHLAVAKRLGVPVLTADTIMARAGERLGLDVEHLQITAE